MFFQCSYRKQNKTYTPLVTNEATEFPQMSACTAALTNFKMSVPGAHLRLIFLSNHNVLSWPDAHSRPGAYLRAGTQMGEYGKLYHILGGVIASRTVYMRNSCKKQHVHVQVY